MSMTDRQSGDVVNVIAPAGGVVSGRLFLYGAASLPLLPITTAEAGEEVACYTRQVVEVETDGALAITAGDFVTPDASGQVAAGTSGLIALTGAAANAGDKLLVLMTGVP